ncbi:signal peptidase II [Arthrobacter zhangbolii]
MTTSSPETPGQTGLGHSTGRKRRAGLLMLLLAAAALAFDQLTKLWVVRTMTEGQITDVAAPLLRWHFIRNPGAAFSIGTDYTWVFTIIMVLVSAFLIYLMFRVRSLGWATALGLVLGGAMGNLMDRLFREPSFGQGHVVDFIAFPNFAIFNIADSCVVSGVILVCLLTLRGIDLDGTRSADSAGIRAGKTGAAARHGAEEPRSGEPGAAAPGSDAGERSGSRLSEREDER